MIPSTQVRTDIDATFSRRVQFSDPIEVSYRDPDGRARLMYLDRNYNDTLGLLHEDASKDSQLHGMPGIDKALLEVRVLSPVDLAVSKLSRFSDEDREDIEASASRERAEHALQAHVGNTDSVKTSIDIACRLVESLAPKRNKAVPK